MIVLRAAKQVFNTEKSERHGGPQKEFLLRFAPLQSACHHDAAANRLRGPPWFSDFSVLKACFRPRRRTGTLTFR